jgi:hypothetical protein
MTRDKGFDYKGEKLAIIEKLQKRKNIFRN